MRVIAGSARRLLLKTLDGLDTRPTTDRIKETLFNMLPYDLADLDVLDLFSGSGAIGIEALSRGARFAVFVEQNDKAVTCIKENLSVTGLTENAMVMACDVLTGLRRLEGKDYVFDFVFMDPPYNQDQERKVLEYLGSSSVINGSTVLIVETSLNTEFTYAEELGFYITKEKTYKTNKHVFLKKESLL